MLTSREYNRAEQIIILTELPFSARTMQTTTQPKRASTEWFRDARWGAFTHYLTRIQPSKCARRDLVSDLYDALQPRGIRLLVYLPIITHSECEDYTAGEISDAFPVCPGRWVDGAQYHVLSYLGHNWCAGEPRFTDGFVHAYTEYVNSRGGVVTWDVPIDQLALLREL
jgi:hypothetical protein